MVYIIILDVCYDRILHWYVDLVDHLQKILMMLVRYYSDMSIVRTF